MSGFPKAGARPSLRNVREAARQSVVETERARQVLLEGVIPGMRNVNARVAALEALRDRGVWGRLSWLVTGR